MEWRLSCVRVVIRKTGHQEDFDDPDEGGEDEKDDENLEIEMH